MNWNFHLTREGTALLGNGNTVCLYAKSFAGAVEVFNEKYPSLGNHVSSVNSFEAVLGDRFKREPSERKF